MQEKIITNLARKLRKTLTTQERKLWYLLRSRRFYNYKFRRQFVIGKFIADFCCYKNKLIIEIDGGQHNQPENVVKDIAREKYLNNLGYKVFRVWNNEINDNLEGVAEKILDILET